MTALDTVLLKAALDIAAKQSEPFVTRSISRVQTALGERRFSTKQAFKPYFETAIRKCSITKTILYRTKPVRLYDFYVDLDLIAEHDVRVNTADIDFFTTYGPALLIVGGAGSGKSTLFKHLFLKAIELGSKIPLFIELRRFNAQPSASLFDLLYTTATDANLNISRELFEALLSHGRFTLFLDGFDELTRDLSKRLAPEINSFAERRRDVTILVTSRPDPSSFTGWQTFTELSVAPLTRERCLTLIGKLNYDAKVKRAFSNAVENRLFQTHKSFLSNPLLTTLMLMTYEQFGNIDERMHVFYSQAFDTLYTKHDASKVGYRREIQCGLNSDDFRAILAAFCVQSYLSSELTFSKDRAIQLIERAQAIADIGSAFDTAAFLHDLTTCVSLLVQDGLDFTFAHRSLQEYFAATFILRAGGRRRRELLRLLRARLTSDDVARLIFDMDQGVFEEEFMLDALDELRQACDYAPGMTWNDAFANLLTRLNAKLGTRHGFWFIRGVRDDGAEPLDLCMFIGNRYLSLKTTTDGSMISSFIRRLHEERAKPATKRVTPDDELMVSSEDIRRDDFAAVLIEDGGGFFRGFQLALTLPEDIKRRHRQRDDAILQTLLTSDGAPRRRRLSVR